MSGKPPFDEVEQAVHSTNFGSAAGTVDLRSAGSLECITRSPQYGQTTKTRSAHSTNGDQPDAALITPALIAWAQRSRVSAASVADKLNVDLSLVEAWQQLDGPHPTFDAQALSFYMFLWLLLPIKPPEDDLRYLIFEV